MKLILPKISLSAIRQGLVDTWESITYIDRDHTPYNKRPGQVESQATIRLERWKGPGGKSIMLKVEEQTKTEHRSSGRVISFSLPMTEAKELARFILDAK